MNIRFPAEWEPQDGILLPWPHPATDWVDILDRAELVFIEIARQISRFEKVIIIAPETAALPEKLAASGVRLENIRLIDVNTNDTWARDYGPITVIANKQPTILDFTFNGWGNKFAAELDNKTTSVLAKKGLFAENLSPPLNMVLEGGSLESDGKGNLLTTSRCLLNPNRNPQMSQEEICQTLNNELGVKNILWLNSGMLQGDDTDSHIDILARFAPNNTILFVECSNDQDPHFNELKAMHKELESFRDQSNQSFRLVPLPMPAPCFDDDGNRLAATYANFLVINGAVLVPTYDVPEDQVACDIIATAFPDREIIAINCLPLIYQGGSLHCSTMQLPQGALA
jgi:agmatine deiminase